MVDSAAGYEYVIGADVDATHPHGDLDRIVIDGGIMPKRTGVSATTGVEKKRILRGEDVCFLMEWVREFLGAVESAVVTTGTTTTTGTDGAAVKTEKTETYDWGFRNMFISEPSLAFDRRVKASQLAGLFTPAGYNLLERRFVDPTWIKQKVVVRSPNMGNYYAQDYGMVTLLELFEPDGFVMPTFASGDGLGFSKLLRLFELAWGANYLGIAVESGFGFPRYPNVTRRFHAEWRTDSAAAWSTNDGDWTNKNIVIGKAYTFTHYGANAGDSYSKTWYHYEAGTTFANLYAPHASRVVALCAFEVNSDQSKAADGSSKVYKTVYVPVEMQELADKHFVFKSDQIAGADFVDELCELYGETWEGSMSVGDYSNQHGDFTCSSWTYMPIVFFDDHTRI